MYYVNVDIDILRIALEGRWEIVERTAARVGHCRDVKIAGIRRRIDSISLGNRGREDQLTMTMSISDNCLRYNDEIVIAIARINEKLFQQN